VDYSTDWSVEKLSVCFFLVKKKMRFFQLLEKKNENEVDAQL